MMCTSTRIARRHRADGRVREIYNGKLLKTSGTVHDGRTLLYRASKRDYDVCPIRAKGCTTADARKIPRDLHEDARDIARRRMKTKALAKLRDERKRVEMRFPSFEQLFRP
jgi:hypothetical protein